MIKYVVDVCIGGCYALFPDSTIRQFRDKAECEKAIRRYEKRLAKQVTRVAMIEWQYSDGTVPQEITDH